MARHACLSLPDDTPLQHRLTVACFAGKASSSRPQRVSCRSTWTSAAVGRPRCSVSARSRHRRPVRNVAPPAHRRERAGPAVVAAAASAKSSPASVLAGAAIVASTRDPAVLEADARARATHAVDAAPRRPAPAVRGATPPAASTTPSRSSASRDDAARLGLPARRRKRGGGRPRGVGVEARSRPSSSSPTRASRAATTAAATRRCRARLARAAGGRRTARAWPTWSRT